MVKKIIEYRIRHKLSQEQLAKEIGVTQQYISKIEEGEFSNLDTIENILEHTGTAVQDKPSLYLSVEILNAQVTIPANVRRYSGTG